MRWIVTCVFSNGYDANLSLSLHALGELSIINSILDRGSRERFLCDYHCGGPGFINSSPEHLRHSHGVQSRLVAREPGGPLFGVLGEWSVLVPPESVEDAERILAEPPPTDAELTALALKDPPPDDFDPP